MRMLVAATVVLLAPAADAAPSFDCAKASSPVEKLICADAGLAAADSSLAAGYTKLIAAHADLKDALRNSQRQWLGERANCVTGKREAQIACLKQRFGERQAKLAGSSLLACAKPVLTGAAFTLRCAAPNSPLHLTAVVTGKKGEYDAELAKLAITANGKTGTFVLKDASIPFEALTGAVELIDVNFDGFDDVKLAVSSSAGPNMGYAYWLYAPKTGGFTASDVGDQLSGFDVMPDAKTRTIAVSGRSSCCSWNSTTYSWRGAKLHATASSDTMSFSPVALPGVDAPATLCGSQTKHFNEAGLITRVDFELDSVKDYTPGGDNLCEKQDLAAQGKLLDKLSANTKGFRLDAKDPYHFTVTFDKPRKDGD
jgi:uncharacterized protein